MNHVVKSWCFKECADFEWIKTSCKTDNDVLPARSAFSIHYLLVVKIEVIAVEK